MSAIESDHWRRQWQIGRLRTGFHIYRHRHFELPDRWVFQPWFTFDRKRPGWRKAALPGDCYAWNEGWKCCHGGSNCGSCAVGIHRKHVPGEVTTVAAERTDEDV